MRDQSSVSESPIVSPDRVRNVVQSVLRAAKIEGWTDPELERLSGVNARTIKSYRVEGKEPSLHNALSLAVVLGPRALNSLLAIIGYSASPLDEADEVNPAMIVAAVLPHLTVIAEASKDGRIDHREAPGCQLAADGIIAAVMPLSSAGGAE